MRTIWIGVCSLSGGLSLSQGAARGSSELMVLGIVLLSIALGIIISAPGASRVIRQHGQAMFRAAIIARIFRIFR